MNIKSLLLGSAAALVAVSGARAADAVTVAEPEPAEYVKICDVYGAGYFYIPGTETCLRIGGYIREDIGVGDAGSLDGVNHVTDHMDGDTHSSYWKQTRFTLKTWTGQETELGTLKTYTELRFNFGNSYGDFGNNGGIDGLGNPNRNGDGWIARNKNDSQALEFAYIQLGGLRVGADESAFDTFVGYAGNVINDTIVPYGGFQTNVIQYYFDAGNGISAVASLEEGSGEVGTIDSYVPHVVGGLKWTQGWGAITGVVAYDSNYESVSGKVRLDVTVNDALSLFAMVGYGSTNHLEDTTNNVNAFGRGFYKPWGGSWAVWGGGTYKFNEKTAFNLQASYDDWKDIGLAANVAYTIVPGMTVTAEVDWQRVGQGSIDHDSVLFGATKKNNVGGLLRFQRDF
ncbi:porin [Mesorhizobium sp. RCC_202]|uniref:porin n=1 Tax=Mesorhizobium sp. RCC_202 TaxID=3239222 RepID=UPI003525C0AF